MIRLLCTVTLVVMLTAGVPRSSAQPVPVTPSSQAALDEAEQLNQRVEKLYGEGKFQGAVAPAEQVLTLREKVVSLWSVSDASTRELMRDYYGELARGTGRAEALRQAKLRLLRLLRYAHPYYWAAFIPAGDWRPLDKTVFSPQKAPP